MNETNPWEDIEKPAKDVSARRVDHSHSLNFFWAKDSRDRYIFFCEFEEGTLLPSSFPRLSGIEVFSPGNRKRLVLVLKSKNDWKLFLALCIDIVRATREIYKTTSSVNIIIRRLNRWREFLKTSKSLLLSEEKIKGLMGELLFLSNYMVPSFGVKQAVLSWRGPEGYSQDFEVNESAIEVKCQSGASSPYVKISSENQLCSQLPNLFLQVFTLSRADSEDNQSLNLPSLIESIRHLIFGEVPDVIDEFNNKLFETGYIDLDDYKMFNYININSVTYEVRGDFPRICRGSLHPAIQRVTYSICLSHCESYLMKPDWLEVRQ